MKLIYCQFRPLTRESVFPHRHDLWEFHYVSEGSCGFLVDREVCSIRTGDFFGIPPQVLHGVQIRSPDERLLQYILHLEPEGEEDEALLRAWTDHRPHGLHQVGGKRHGFFERLKRSQSGDLWEKKSAEHRLLAFLCEQLSGKNHQLEPHPAIGECLYLMQSRLGGNLSLDEMAERVHMDKSYLVRLFKKETGSTPSATYLRQKMVLAAEIMLNRDRSLLEVGEKVGIPDPTQFSRCFKRIFGISPMAYRKKQWKALSMRQENQHHL